MAVNRKNLCPNCGAKLTGLELKCPECGYVLTQESGVGQSTTESLQELQDKLLAVDKVFNLGKSSSKKKASIINAFPIPQTLESLTRLLHMSYSNFEAAKEAGDKHLAMAWLGKASECYHRLSGFKNEAGIDDILEKYKILADKKAFAKLSGSRSKKRIIAIIGAVVIALITSFVLWYDWAGLLVKNGREDVAVRLLEFVGRKNQAIEVLTSAGHFEKAAELLFANKQIVKAVALLSQQGDLEHVLAMISKIDSPDTIHACVNEIGKYYSITGRESYYLEDNIIINDFDGTINYVYNHDPQRVQKQVRQKDSLTIWEDLWNIYRDIDIPEPRYFRFSELLSNYRAYGHWSLYSPPVIQRNHQNMITKVIFTPESGWSDEKRFELTYNTIGLNLLKEEVYYKGIHTGDIIYERNQSGLLSKVLLTFILSKEEVDSVFDNSDNVSYNALSRTYTFVYDTMGRISMIIDSLDAYDGIEMNKYVFRYLNNIRLVETSKLNVAHYNSEGAKVYDVDPAKEFSIFCDGSIVECFVINTETEQWDLLE